MWPTANDPQTPSLPGTKRPPDFGHHSGCTPHRVGYLHGRRLQRQLLTPSGALSLLGGRGRSLWGQLPTPSYDRRYGCSGQLPLQPETRPSKRTTRHQAQRGSRSGRKAVSVRRLSPLTFTYIHRTHLGGIRACKRSRARKSFWGRPTRPPSLPVQENRKLGNPHHRRSSWPVHGRTDRPPPTPAPLCRRQLASDLSRGELDPTGATNPPYSQSRRGLPPSKRPALPGPLMGRWSHKSSQGSG